MKVDQKPLKFISDYISHLNEALQELRGQKLSYTQLSWPTKPEPLLDYPKKYQLAIKLLEDFKRSFPEMKIKALLADALYGHLPFIQGIENIWEGIQIITKMRKNQRVLHRKKCYANHHYFSSYAGCKQEITVRGREKKIVIAGGERLYVPSHSAKRFVIAVKYENEKDYRYLMATNLSWNMKEVMQTFSIRWLIEVFFADWSGYHGFCSLAKQCGFEGSLQPLILLFDHCFLFHVDQCDLLKQEQSLATFGSLVEKSRAQAFCHFIQQILEEESPKEKLKELVNSLDDLYPLRSSKKHMMGVAA